MVLSPFRHSLQKHGVATRDSPGGERNGVGGSKNEKHNRAREARKQI